MPERRLRTAVLLLALAGAGIAAYLTQAHYADARVACATGGCETVLASPYAEVAGIPVALIGLAGYVLIAATAALRGEAGAVLGLALTGAGCAFALYLVYVQVALVGAVCLWCLANDAVVLAALLASVLRLRSARPAVA